MMQDRTVYTTQAGEMVSVATHVGRIGGLVDWILSSLLANLILIALMGSIGAVAGGAAFLALSKGLGLLEFQPHLGFGIMLPLGGLTAVILGARGAPQDVIASAKSVMDPELYLMAGPGGVAFSLPWFTFGSGYAKKHYTLGWDEIAKWIQFSGMFGIEQLQFSAHEGWSLSVNLLPYAEPMREIAEAIQRAASDPDLDPEARPKASE